MTTTIRYPDRRAFLAAALSSLAAALPARADAFPDAALQKEMYDAALAIARKKIRGGPAAPVFKTPYLDAAFSDNIFLWDTCCIAAWAKYHQDDLPIRPALDNFYERQSEDGFICREYLPDGSPMWPKHHPVSINPPLLAFAELELFGQKKDVERLAAVYPMLRRCLDYLVKTYRCDDLLFFSDALGSGMDNIPRYPDGWKDDGEGIGNATLHPEIFTYDGLSPRWNRQGRSVDFSAQMALFADNLAEIARLIGRDADIPAYRALHGDTVRALNERCWSEEDGFYYDLGYGKRIRRKHIGMFWTLLAGAVPSRRIAPMLGHLTDPGQFWRTVPVASYPADQPGFSPQGTYWLGGMWMPTTYMTIRGLLRIGQKELATRLARRAYACVAEVFAATHTFWENYAPDAVTHGNIARPDFCGWTALAPITLYREFIAV